MSSHIRSVAIATVPLRGEIQTAAFVLKNSLGEYFYELNRSPKQIAERERGEVIFTSLRHCAHLFSDASLARVYGTFLSPDYTCVIEEVFQDDRALGASIHKARQLPDMESRRKRQDAFKTNLKPARVDWVQGTKRY